MNTLYEKGVEIFIVQDQNILLLQRISGPFNTYWQVPSGKVEPQESFEDAVRREAVEETGYRVEPIKEIGTNVNQQYGFESHMFTAKITDGSLKNNEPHKHSAIQWFKLSELPEKLGGTTQKGLTIIQQK